MNSERLASFQIQEVSMAEIRTWRQFRGGGSKEKDNALDLPKYPEQQPDASVPGRPIVLNLAIMDQSSQTERMWRQLQRWCQSTSESKPPTPSITELLPLEFQYQEPELPIEESPAEIKHTRVEESTQTTEQQANLSGGQKQIKSQPKIITDFNMPIAPQKLERIATRASKCEGHGQVHAETREATRCIITALASKTEQATKKLPNMGTLRVKIETIEELIQRGVRNQNPMVSGYSSKNENKFS
ncbi:hypothetical protein LOK49_LG11G01018 [Camellia lanceoleosa]|uniref:Uncharacterized protein n=1 Tax=Camellia lanceoleosa TaxID=1840588 RepID=A0ACC0FYL2_9ERIC|nr:hypothetical protein LOK49_LG11G01018 [Camellia lanceoleosa]